METCHGNPGRKGRPEQQNGILTSSPTHRVAATAKRLKLSFCTACANRTHQLKKVYEENVEAIAGDVATEWIILNFGSTDDLDDFMASRLPHSPNRVIYVRAKSNPPWHASVAKNMAHRLAAGDVLINLDCDNRINDAIAQVRDFFSQGARLLHLWSGVMPDGTYGRIAVERDVFRQVGGYNEEFLPMGYQDTDLIRRISTLGFLCLHARVAPDSAVRNTKEESVSSCPHQNLTWRDFNEQNKEHSVGNIATGQIIANTGLPWSPLSIDLLQGCIPDVF